MASPSLTARGIGLEAGSLLGAANHVGLLT